MSRLTHLAKRRHRRVSSSQVRRRNHEDRHLRSRNVPQRSLARDAHNERRHLSSLNDAKEEALTVQAAYDSNRLAWVAARYTDRMAYRCGRTHRKTHGGESRLVTALTAAALVGLMSWLLRKTERDFEERGRAPTL